VTFAVNVAVLFKVNAAGDAPITRFPLVIVSELKISTGPPVMFIVPPVEFFTSIAPSSAVSAVLVP